MTMTKHTCRFLIFGIVCMAVISSTGATNGGSTISGRITDHTQRSLATLAVPLRSIDIVGRTVTDESGRFLFKGFLAGQYIVEVVNASGDVVAASSLRRCQPSWLTALAGCGGSHHQVDSDRASLLPPIRVNVG